MPNVSNQKSQQKGFALLEVLISTVVISVAIIAFFKLSNISTQRAKHTQNYSNAHIVTNSLLSLLQATPSFAEWLANTKNGNITVQTTIDETYQCNGDSIAINDNNSWCSANSNAIHQDLFTHINTIFANSFQRIEKRAIMCLRTNGNRIRITTVWKIPSRKNDGTSQFVQISPNDCPSSYTGEIPHTEHKENINLDRGYLDIYSQI